MPKIHNQHFSLTNAIWSDAPNEKLSWCLKNQIEKTTIGERNEDMNI